MNSKRMLAPVLIAANKAGSATLNSMVMPPHPRLGTGPWVMMAEAVFGYALTTFPSAACAFTAAAGFPA